MNKYCKAANETCPQNVLREVMAKKFQNVAHTSRKLFEEVSCTHSMKKKEHALKLDFKGLSDGCKSNHKGVLAHTSQNNHQEKNCKQ